MGLIVLRHVLHGDARVVIWIAGTLTFIGATLIAGTGEWIIRTGHFAERHGLIIIIALGEVVVALGDSVVVPLASEEGVPARRRQRSSGPASSPGCVVVVLRSGAAGA